MKLIKSDIELYDHTNDKAITFSIIHNLPEVPGLSVQDALDNWLQRTDDYTDTSFANYIRSKVSEAAVFTVQEFQKKFPEFKL